MSIDGKITGDEISERQMKLIETMSKYVVLVSISLGTTVVSFVIMLWRTVGFLTGGTNEQDLVPFYFFDISNICS